MGHETEVTLSVNGRQHRLTVDPATPLIYILRNDLGLNGPKYGCGLGECGACAVLINGKAARSCTLPVGGLADKRIVTLEGLGTVEAPSPVQQGFIEGQGAQCGYCLNGMIIAATALLAATPDPSDTDIREALRHHLCRCGTHIEIIASIRRAATLLAGAATGANP